MRPLNRFHPVGFDPAKAAAALQAAGIDAMLLTSPENVYYTTGYTALPSAGNPILHMLRNRLPFFSLVTSTGKVTLLCWAFSTWNMDFGVDEVIGFNNLDEGLAAVQRILFERCPRGTTLGIESTCPYLVLRVVGAARGEEGLVAVDQVLDGLRLIKSPAETALLQESLRTIEKTCNELFDLLHVGMGRSTLTREAKARLIRNGADGISHVTLSFTGANPEFDIDEKLESGKLVTLDLGGIYRGYCSDNRRYAFSGKVPPTVKDVHAKMVDMVDAVGAALVPGKPYHELMVLTRELYDRVGLKPLGRFNHVGHNIGLETEERWLDDDSDAKVEAGMVINIELYSTTPDGAQIGDEETFVINAAGPERISQLSREIREIA